MLVCVCVCARARARMCVISTHCHINVRSKDAHLRQHTMYSHVLENIKQWITRKMDNIIVS